MGLAIAYDESGDSWVRKGSTGIGGAGLSSSSSSTPDSPSAVSNSEFGNIRDRFYVSRVSLHASTFTTFSIGFFTSFDSTNRLTKSVISRCVLFFAAACFDRDPLVMVRCAVVVREGVAIKLDADFCQFS